MPVVSIAETQSHQIHAEYADVVSLQKIFSQPVKKLILRDLALDSVDQDFELRLEEQDIFDSNSDLFINGKRISRVGRLGARYFVGKVLKDSESLVVMALRQSGQFRGIVSMRQNVWRVDNDTANGVIKSQLLPTDDPLLFNPFINDMRELGLIPKSIPAEDLGRLLKKKFKPLPLRSGETLLDLSGSPGWDRAFFIDVPAGQDFLTVRIHGSLETSVFIRKETEPDGLESSDGTFDSNCRGEVWRECTIAGPSEGRYFVSLYAFDYYEGVSIRAGYDRSLGENELYEVTIAVDTDYNFFQLFGDISAAEDYVAALFASVSLIYEREANTRIKVGPLVLYTSPSEDPYVETTSECRLDEVARFWNANYSDQPRATVAHLTAKEFGGLAWRDAFCWDGYIRQYDPNDYEEACVYSGTEQIVGSYSVSGVDGVTPSGSLQLDWDTKVVAHELGHNFSSAHTHCYAGVGGSSEPVDACYAEEDSCWSGEVSYPGPNSLTGGDPGGKNGTIMSYCHTIDGGLQNIAGTFGLNHHYGIQPARVARRISDAIASTFSSDPSCVKKIVGTTSSSYETISATFGLGGSISPSGDVPVLAGSTASFLLAPDPGYTVYRVEGSCGGTVVGDRFNTDVITEDCTVIVEFVESGVTFTVTPSAGNGGRISPVNPVVVLEGETAIFELEVFEGFALASVDGTCGGDLDGSSFVTEPVFTDCSVSASFEPTGGDFSTSDLTSQIYKWDDATCNFAEEAEGHALVNDSNYSIELSGFYALRDDGSVYWSSEYNVKESMLKPGYLTAKGWCVSADDRSPYGTDVYETYWKFINPLTGEQADSNFLNWANEADAEFTVTPSSSVGGSISPSSPQSALSGDQITFSLVSDANYVLSSVNGTCGGLLSGTTYTTSPISSDCTVEAKFEDGVLTSFLIPATACKASAPSESLGLQFKEWGFVNTNLDRSMAVTCGIPRLVNSGQDPAGNSQFGLSILARKASPGNPSLLRIACNFYEQAGAGVTFLQETNVPLDLEGDAYHILARQVPVSAKSSYVLSCELPPDTAISAIKVEITD